MELKDATEILERFKEIIPNTIGIAVETLLQSLENKDKEIKELKEELKEYKDSNRVLKSLTYIKILSVNSEIEEFWDNIPKKSTKAIIRLHLLHRIKDLLNELKGDD